MWRKTLWLSFNNNFVGVERQVFDCIHEGLKGNVTKLLFKHAFKSRIVYTNERHNLEKVLVRQSSIILLIILLSCLVFLNHLCKCHSAKRYNILLQQIKLIEEKLVASILLFVRIFDVEAEGLHLDVENRKYF